MGLLDGFLVLVILVLLYIVYDPTIIDKVKSYFKSPEKMSIEPALRRGVLENAGIVSPPGPSKVSGRNNRMEESMHSDGIEYFNSIDKLMHNYNCGTGEDYSAHEYGSDNSTYADYVMEKGVDAAVLENHQKFVSENKALNKSGRTYTPDMHMSYDPIPWVGLRRPQNVPVGDPDQVPDIDTSLYQDAPNIFY